MSVISTVSLAGNAAATQPAAAQSAAPAATRDRMALLDFARLVAAVGIVWVHAAKSPAGLLLYPIGTFGVPFYIFVAVLFTGRALTRPNSKSLAAYAGSRVFRIYLPFLFWSVLYVLLGEVKARVACEPLVPVDGSILYAGGYTHLWFLPFMLVVTLAAGAILRAVERRALPRATVALLCVGLGVAACFLHEPAWITRRGDDGYFWHFAFRALPSVFWSIALVLITVFDGKLPRSSQTIAFGGGVLFVTALLLEAIFTPLPALRSLAGLGCVGLALLPVASGLITRVARLGRYSYGIYLSHIAFLRVITIATDHLQIRPSLATDVASFAIAFAVASVLSVLLSRSVWTRWTIGE